MLVTKSYVEVASETSDAFNQGTNSPDEANGEGAKTELGCPRALHVHSSGPRCLSGSGSQGLRFGRREGATELAESPTFLIFASLTSDETVSTHNVPTRKWGEEQANLRRWHIPAQSHQHHQARRRCGEDGYPHKGPIRLFQITLELENSSEVFLRDLGDAHSFQIGRRSVRPHRYPES